MANSLATQNGTLIAQKTLTTLLEEFPLLSAITLDAAPGETLFNQAVKVQLPSATTASDYSETDGYVAADQAQTEVTLTINKFKHSTFSFDDVERSSTQVDLIQRFSRAAAHALGKALMADLFALVLAAAYTNSTTVAAGAFARSTIVAANKKLDGRNLPTAGRFAVLGPDYLEGLLNDSTLVANAGSPSNVVRTGILGNVYGVNVMGYPSIPTNSQNLAGIMGIPEGLLLAVRAPQIPTGADLNCAVQNVTEEKSGITLQVRSWYDPKLGKEFRTFALQYGVAVGQAAALERFKTA